ncbi:MAG: (2Fe-2S) ferredoxin domain-containing protein [Candidatus Cloacimonetes bacterium]|nr:(2Fe-2S) ferredoxin domain-containing protein [Candidatus Cloacimonadota bacterium]
MNKTKLSDLKTIQAKRNAVISKYKAALMVCAGTGCVSAGSLSLKDVLEKELKKRKLENDFMVVPTGCNGFCAQGPILVIQPEGVFYQKVKNDDVSEILDKLQEGKYLIDIEGM